MTTTLADPLALTRFESATVKDSVKTPFEASVLAKLPVPKYGPVPPVAEMVQVKGLPAVTPETEHETLMRRGCAVTLTVAVPDAVTPFASITVNVSTMEPLTGAVLLMVPVPL